MSDIKSWMPTQAFIMEVYKIAFGSIEKAKGYNHKQVLERLIKMSQESTVAFDTKAGETYFEYERKDGSRFLSIIGWDEWNLDKYELEFIRQVVWK